MMIAFEQGAKLTQGIDILLERESDTNAVE